MKMSPSPSLRERTAALRNCLTAQQVDLIRLLLCSGERDAKDLHKTSLVVSPWRDASRPLGLRREGCRSSGCVRGSRAVPQPGPPPRGTLVSLKAAADSKSKPLISSVQLLNASQNTQDCDASSNERQKGLQIVVSLHFGSVWIKVRETLAIAHVKVVGIVSPTLNGHPSLTRNLVIFSTEAKSWIEMKAELFYCYSLYTTVWGNSLIFICSVKETQDSVSEVIILMNHVCFACPFLQLNYCTAKHFYRKTTKVIAWKS